MGNKQSPGLIAELVEANKTRIEPLLYENEGRWNAPIFYNSARDKTIEVHYVCLKKDKSEFKLIESASVALGVKKSNFKHSPGEKVPTVSTEKFYRNAGLTFSKPLGSFTLYFYFDDHTISKSKLKKLAIGKVWPSSIARKKQKGKEFVAPRNYTRVAIAGHFPHFPATRNKQQNPTAILVVNNDSPYPYDSIKTEAEKAAIMEKACVSESFNEATRRSTIRKRRLEEAERERQEFILEQKREQELERERQRELQREFEEQERQRVQERQRERQRQFQELQREREQEFQELKRERERKREQKQRRAKLKLEKKEEQERGRQRRAKLEVEERERRVKLEVEERERRVKLEVEEQQRERERQRVQEKQRAAQAQAQEARAQARAAQAKTGDVTLRASASASSGSAGPIVTVINPVTKESHAVALSKDGPELYANAARKFKISPHSFTLLYAGNVLPWDTALGEDLFEQMADATAVFLVPKRPRN